MHSASSRGFTKRSPGDSPVSVHNLPFGTPLPKSSISQAKNAVLRKGGERVLVHNIKSQPDGTFVGQIYGFEPSFAPDFDGMKVADPIAFDDAHVFSCGY
jgi:hypothetical protein